jgi:hypothetical protein
VRGGNIGAVEATNEGDGGFTEQDRELAFVIPLALAIGNVWLYARFADAGRTSRMSYRL